MAMGVKQLYFGTTTGRTYIINEDVFADVATNIPVRIKTKQYYPAGPNRITEIQQIFVYADSPQTTIVSISFDEEDYEVLGQLNSETQPNRFDVWRNCNKFSLAFDEISSNNIGIKGFSITHLPQPEIL